MIRCSSAIDPKLKRKGLKILLDNTNQLVVTDPELLTRIIENFIANAIAYTQEGFVKISCVSKDETLKISVSDSGIGIPEEYIERIFEEYVQLGNSSREEKKGLGLGLSIVKHIADLLNHALEVQSIVGEGSTFSIIVPCIDNIIETRQSGSDAVNERVIKALKKKYSLSC